jgi:hypothetical protein
MSNEKEIIMEEIKIGFKYSVFYNGNFSWDKYWESFEVVGILYSNGYNGGRTEWKNKADILNSLEKQLQVVSLNDKNQQKIFIRNVTALQRMFESDSKLLPEFKTTRID